MKNISSLLFTHNFLLFTFYLLPFALFSQDIHFSQVLNAPLLLNPATAGTGEGDFRTSLTHRSQWMGITEYNTSTVSYDMPLLKSKTRAGYLGAGMNVFADKAGTAQFGTTQATLSVSGILLLDDFQKLSAGLHGGIAQRSATLSKISWGNQFNGDGFDQNISSNEAPSASFVYPDIGAGINYEFNQDHKALLGEDITKADAGVAIFHPHSPKQKFLGSTEKLSPKLAIHASAYRDFNDIRLAVIPSLAFFKQGPHKETNLGMRLRYRIHEGTKWSGVFRETAISFACLYRVKDAILPALFFETGNYLVSITYDYPVSKLRTAGMTSNFEVSFIYSHLGAGRRKG